MVYDIKLFLGWVAYYTRWISLLNVDEEIRLWEWVEWLNIEAGI